MTVPYKGLKARYGTREGVITRIKNQARADSGVVAVWWTPKNTEKEYLFTPRRDGKWRMFPGPADAGGLVMYEGKKELTQA
jgi:hypothetical protein